MQMRKNLFLIAGGALAIILAIALVVPLIYWGQTSSGSFIRRVETTPSRLPVQMLELSEDVPLTGSDRENCTYPEGYWLEQISAWPERVTLGNRVYSSAEILAIFNANEDGTSLTLIRSMYVTMLNILHGAQNNAIISTLEDANEWLVDSPPGSSLSDFNRRRGNELASLLNGYNEGVFGPGLCPDAPSPIEAGAAPPRGQALPQTGLSPVPSLAPSSTSTILSQLVEPVQPVETAQPDPTEGFPSLEPTQPPPPPEPTATSTPGYAQNGFCDGTIGSITIDDDLEIPSNATCTLTGTRVMGNISVHRNGVLYASGIFVDGNVKAESANRVDILAGTYIEGNLQISRSAYVQIISTSIDGNLDLDGNTQNLSMVGNTIDGNFLAYNNSGGLLINGNTIHGNLQCKDNSPLPTGAGNLVYGNAEDQCANMR
jgi:hypothetical protein